MYRGKGMRENLALSAEVCRELWLYSDHHWTTEPLHSLWEIKSTTCPVTEPVANKHRNYLEKEGWGREMEFPPQYPFLTLLW